MVEVDDPKTCLMFHMMTTLEPIDPVLESPLSDPMSRQTAAACSLLTEIAATKVASEGMLLANLEKDGNKIHPHDEATISLKTMTMTTHVKTEKSLKYNVYYDINTYLYLCYIIILKYI